MACAETINGGECDVRARARPHLRLLRLLDHVMPRFLNSISLRPFVQNVLRAAAAALALRQATVVSIARANTEK